MQNKVVLTTKKSKVHNGSLYHVYIVNMAKKDTRIMAFGNWVKKITF